MAEQQKSKRTSVRQSKTRDPRTVNRFVEELGWLLDSYANLDFKALADRERADRNMLAHRQLGRHVSRNPNIHFLVGCLPIIFVDERYFSNNEDIVEFAREALDLPIPRWEKRSRYELIGLIVCETAALNDQRLAHLVDALSKITSEDPNAQEILRARKTNALSWNEIIQKLTRGDV